VVSAACGDACTNHQVLRTSVNVRNAAGGKKILNATVEFLRDAVEKKKNY